jgi:hypothetical protein
MKQIEWFDVSYHHVIDQVKKDFNTEDEEYVLKILNKYGVERYETQPDFIRLANGRKETLEPLLKTAKMDKRDILGSVHQEYGLNWLDKFLNT